MSENGTQTARKPGIVIFAAVLNFFSAGIFFMTAAFTALAMVFGAAWGFDEYVTQQMSRLSTNPNFSYGLTLIFGVATGVLVFLAAFFLLIGLGLLRGKKYAWYLQVAMSTLGLLSLPVSLLAGPTMLPLGSVLNIVILVLFFQKHVRSFFRI